MIRPNANRSGEKNCLQKRCSKGKVDPIIVVGVCSNLKTYLTHIPGWEDSSPACSSKQTTKPSKLTNILKTFSKKSKIDQRKEEKCGKLTYYVWNDTKECEFFVILHKTLVFRIVEFSGPVIVENVPENVRISVKKVFFGCFVEKEFPFIGSCLVGQGGGGREQIEKGLEKRLMNESNEC